LPLVADAPAHNHGNFPHVRGRPDRVIIDEEWIKRAATDFERLLRHRLWLQNGKYSHCKTIVISFAKQ